MAWAHPVFCTRCNRSDCGHLRDSRKTQLTPREVDVVRAVCHPANAGTKEIGAAIGLTEGTVSVYLNRIGNKIGAPYGAGRTHHLILWAMAHRKQLGIKLPRAKHFMWRDQKP